MQGRGKTVLGCTIDAIDVCIVSMPELRVCVYYKIECKYRPRM